MFRATFDSHTFDFGVLIRNPVTSPKASSILLEFSGYDQRVSEVTKWKFENF